MDDFELDAFESYAKIVVIGVGGAGSNAVNQMLEEKIANIEFWVFNTDAQALATSKAENRLVLGRQTTRGLGAGGDPQVGREAALDSVDDIKRVIEGANMVFIAAGMGGGTGTGAAPVVAKIAKELGILTIAVVTKPFSWEGRKRQNQANQGLEKLRESVDAVIVVPNDKLLQVVDRQVSLTESFLIVDEVLLRGVQGISDIITIPGMINVDFADVKSVMQGSGSALMGIGRAQGEGRAVKAAEIAINSQLLESSINGATGVIVNITGGPDMTLHEISDAANIIHDAVTEDATVIIGTAVNENIQNEINVTVIATGFEVKKNIEMAKTDVKQLSASDFFAGTSFSGGVSSTANNATTEAPRRSSMPQVSTGFSNIEIPDFLKK